MAGVVEKWIPHTRRRKDLYDIIDIVGCPRKPSRYPVYGVQATSAGGMSARLKKLKENPNTLVLLRAGWGIFLYGWKKNQKTNRWEVKIVNIGELPPWPTKA